MAAKLKPDVVLMDLQLGAGIDGVEATRRISRAPRRASHVLVLTTYDTDADITRAIEAGATGYLLKAERPEELFAAIHAAAQGRTDPLRAGRRPRDGPHARRGPPRPDRHASWTSWASSPTAWATARSPAPCSSARRR